MEYRIAVSMRMVEQLYSNGASELRDALAQDWGHFLKQVLPELCWFPIPNLEQDAIRMVEAFHINGVILTGGDDWGRFPRRDATEELLLNWAQAKSVPVLGICRGAQVINHFFGGNLSVLPPKSHVGGRHSIQYGNGQLVQVNSYHHLGLYPPNLAKPLHPLATAPDGTIEAFTLSGTGLWQGILWHPEREATPAPHDTILFQTLFRKTA